MECEPCEPAEEAEAEAEPAAQAKVRGAKGVPPSWATTPSVPSGGRPKAPNRACATTRTRTACASTGCCTWQAALARLRLQGRRYVRAGAQQQERAPGMPWAARCARIAKRRAMRPGGEDGALPAWESLEAHKGYEHFVFHKGRECVTMPSSGEARPLCKCGACFRGVLNFQHEYAVGCVHNDAPPVRHNGVPGGGEAHGYCSNCAVASARWRSARQSATTSSRRSWRSTALRARPTTQRPQRQAKTPYAQQNPTADYAARVVVRTGNGNRAASNGRRAAGARSSRARRPGRARAVVRVLQTPTTGTACAASSRRTRTTCAPPTPSATSRPRSWPSANTSRPPFPTTSGSSTALCRRRQRAARRAHPHARPHPHRRNRRKLPRPGGVRRGARARGHLSAPQQDGRDCHDPLQPRRLRGPRHRQKGAVVLLHVAQGESGQGPPEAQEGVGGAAGHARQRHSDVHRPTHPDYLEVLPPKEEGRAFFSFELYYDNINGMTEAQQEARRTDRVNSLKRAAQKRKAEVGAAAESDSD